MLYSIFHNVSFYRVYITIPIYSILQDTDALDFLLARRQDNASETVDYRLDDLLSVRCKHKDDPFAHCNDPRGLNNWEMPVVCVAQFALLAYLH